MPISRAYPDDDLITYIFFCSQNYFGKILELFCNL